MSFGSEPSAFFLCSSLQDTHLKPAFSCPAWRVLSTAGIWLLLCSRSDKMIPSGLKISEYPQLLQQKCWILSFWVPSKQRRNWLSTTCSEKVFVLNEHTPLVISAGSFERALRELCVTNPLGLLWKFHLWSLQTLFIDKGFSILISYLVLIPRWLRSCGLASSFDHLSTEPDRKKKWKHRLIFGNVRVARLCSHCSHGANPSAFWYQFNNITCYGTCNGQSWEWQMLLCGRGANSYFPTEKWTENTIWL